MLHDVNRHVHRHVNKIMPRGCGSGRKLRQTCSTVLWPSVVAGCSQCVRRGCRRRSPSNRKRLQLPARSGGAIKHPSLTMLRSRTGRMTTTHLLDGGRCQRRQQLILCPPSCQFSLFFSMSSLPMLTWHPPQPKPHHTVAQPRSCVHLSLSNNDGLSKTIVR